MAKKFGALADFRQTQIDSLQTQIDSLQQEVDHNVTDVKSVQELVKSRGRPTGKRSNPDYEPTTVLLRKQTKRKTSRLLEDIDSEHDLSELIEILLGKWIAEHL